MKAWKTHLSIGPQLAGRLEERAEHYIASTAHLLCSHPVKTISWIEYRHFMSFHGIIYGFFSIVQRGWQLYCFPVWHSSPSNPLTTEYWWIWILGARVADTGSPDIIFFCKYASAPQYGWCATFLSDVDLDVASHLMRPLHHRMCSFRSCISFWLDSALLHRQQEAQCRHHCVYCPALCWPKTIIPAKEDEGDNIDNLVADYASNH